MVAVVERVSLYTPNCGMIIQYISNSRDHHDSSVNRTSVGDDSDEDDDYLYMTAAGGYQLPPSTQSQTLLRCGH